MLGTIQPRLIDPAKRSSSSHWHGNEVVTDPAGEQRVGCELWLAGPEAVERHVGAVAAVGTRSPPPGELRSRLPGSCAANNGYQPLGETETCPAVITLFPG
jgi:hypothetical protein